MKKVVIFPVLDDEIKSAPNNVRTAIHVSAGWYFITENGHIVDNRGMPVFTTLDPGVPAEYIIPGECYDEDKRFHGLFDYNNDDWWPPLLPMPPGALDDIRKNKKPSMIVPGFYHADAYFRRKHMEYEVKTGYRHVKTWADFYSDSVRLVVGFVDALAVVRIPWNFRKKL